ncbi:hypothetical protein EXS53_02355 [Patescibacteria group bacterium]|nr:hypothetical protein [Patescibacteria group bacterium]
MVVATLTEWVLVIHELRLMLLGDCIDAFFIEYKAPISGAPMSSFYTFSSMKELDIIGEVLPSVLPKATAYEISPKGLVTIGGKPFRVANIKLIQDPP